MKNFKKLMFCLSMMFSHLSYGQKTLKLDLASIKPGETKTLSENINLSYDSVLLTNVVHTKKYKVWYEMEAAMLDPLNTSSMSSSKIDGFDGDIKIIAKDILTFLENIKTNRTRSELDIKNIVLPEFERQKLAYRNKVKSKQGEFEKTEDDNKQTKLDRLKAFEFIMNDIITSADSLFQRLEFMKIDLKTGQTVKIYVQSGESKWTFILKGKQPGKWVTTYGFGFTSQRLESPSFHAKQIPDTSAFQILKSRRADYFDLNYVPAIFFSYFPSQNFNSCWNHSLTAGLGFGLNLSSAPIVFLGYNAMFYNNIGFSLGIAFHQQHRLKSQYDEFDIVSSVLDKDQLHDKVYRPNLFFAINFRFGENPFKTGNADVAE